MSQSERKRGEVSRDAILKAAQIVFAEHGFDGARVEAIAQLSGYDKKLLFHYFRDKLGLYVAVLRQADKELNAWLSGLSTIWPSGKTPAAKAQALRTFLETLVRMTFTHLVAHPDFLRILTWEMAEGWQTYARIAAEFSSEDDDPFARLFREAQDAKLLRSDFPAAVQLSLILHLCQSYLASLPLYRILNPGQDMSTSAMLTDAREHLVTLIVSGMMADPGPRGPEQESGTGERPGDRQGEDNRHADQGETRNRRHIYFRNADLDYFLQYALACQTYQGSTYGECFQAASQVREDDLESWVQAWSAVAGGAETTARQAEASGHRLSASGAYLRAATYHAVALVCVSPRETRFKPIYETFQSSFRKFAALQEVPLEAVSLPFDGKALPGYFWRAPGAGKRPTLIMLGDRFAEEMYVWGGAPAAHRRGYNVLLIDLPGQGITPFDGLSMTASAEKPVGAMVDYLLSRDDVDPSRIALFGMAASGYMAVRAAAFEKRISACIADAPVDDMERLMTAEAPSDVSANEAALRSVLFDFAAWQGGKARLSDLFDLFKSMKVDEVRAIACPMLCLVSAGEVAERIRQARTIYEALPNPRSAFRLFTAEEGADAHNQANNLSLLHETVFDWLDDIYREP